MCVFFSSLLLLELQPSLIICSEKVIFVAEPLLSVVTHHLQYTVVVLFMQWFSGIHCMLHWNYFLLNAFVFSAFAIKQGGFGVHFAGQWNPSALVLQSITTYCRKAFRSRVSVWPLSSLLLCSFSTCLSWYIECPLCLYWSVSQRMYVCASVFLSLAASLWPCSVLLQ